jgi:hypothetical protein
MKGAEPDEALAPYVINMPEALRAYGRFFFDQLTGVLFGFLGTHPEGFRSRLKAFVRNGFPVRINSHMALSVIIVGGSATAVVTHPSSPPSLIQLVVLVIRPRGWSGMNRVTTLYCQE